MELERLQLVRERLHFVPQCERVCGLLVGLFGVLLLQVAHFGLRFLALDCPLLLVARQQREFVLRLLDVGELRAELGRELLVGTRLRLPFALRALVLRLRLGQLLR